MVESTADISPSVALKVLRHPLHQRIRWISEINSRDLPGQMRRGRRMANQDINCLVDLRQPASLDQVAQESLVAVVMSGGIEFECALAYELRLQFQV